MIKDLMRITWNPEYKLKIAENINLYIKDRLYFKHQVTKDFVKSLRDRFAVNQC